MKFNFRKIASVIASTVMLSSTVALAAAANSYPAPFITSNVADVAVVYPSSALAAPSDMLAALDIVNDLNSKTLTSTLGTTGGSTTLVGEGKAIETGSQALYLGDFMNTTKSTFTKSELPKVLADATVTDSDGTAITVTSKIITPNARILYSKTSDNLATPILNVDFPNSNTNYSTEIVFSPSANLTKLASKDITLFGKKFSFSGSAADLTTTKAVLYESSQTLTINSGESQTVTVGNKQYVIKVTGVESATGGSITVNDVSQTVAESTSYKVSGLDLYIKNVLGASVAGEVRSMEISVGSAKLTLTDAASVTKGSTTVDGTTATFTSSAGKVSKITIAVQPSSQTPSVNYLKIGDSITEPVFGGYKITFGSYAPALDAESKDKIVIKSSGETAGSLEWINKAGSTYSLSMFRPGTETLNASKLTTATAATTYNVTTLGDFTNGYKFAINEATNITKNDYFITTSGQYSQIWRINAITLSTDNYVTISDVGSLGDKSVKVTLSGASSGSTGTWTLGDGNTGQLTLNGNGSTDTAKNVTITSAASPLLWTKSGALINLTRIANSTQYANISQILITEETTYNDGSWTKNTGGTVGSTINVSLLYYSAAAPTGNDLRVDTVTVGDSGTSVSVGDYDTYYLTMYGSFAKKTGNNDQIFTLYYPGTAASAKVQIADISSTLSGTGAIKAIAVKDSDAVTAKNQIVVGGSCINTVAATLLGGAWCGDEFTTNTGVGAGSYLIETFAKGTDGVSTLVAGYNADDTKNAATAFRTLTSLDFSATKAYTGSTTTAVTPKVTATA